MYYICIMEKSKTAKAGISDKASAIECDDGKSAVSRLVFSFSLGKVLPTMFCTELPKTNVITSLHGLKVLSLTWIILGHTHLWSIFFDSNSVHVAEHVVTRFSYQAVLSSLFGFDSFFLLSGVLLAYVALNKLAKKEKSTRIYT